MAWQRPSRENRDRPTQLAAELAKAALRLTSAADLDPLVAAIGDARYVLLGEASHGTSEFYT